MLIFKLFTDYDLLECRGCESITLRSTMRCSEWEPGEYEIHYYPPRVSRRLPVWADKLSSEIAELLEEVYTALHADSRRLATMGARAIIDMVMNQTVGDVGSFPDKLKRLESEGYISKKNREIIEAALEVGHAASHRGHKPDSRQVQHVMDIVENLLHTGILGPIAKNLEARTPQRKKPPKKS